jgi:hypothetical protein
MSAICQKANLELSLSRVGRIFPDEYDFCPRTWVSWRGWRSGMGYEFHLKKNEVRTCVSSRGRRQGWITYWSFAAVAHTGP